jgi:hypothetical protein
LRGAAGRWWPRQVSGGEGACHVRCEKRPGRRNGGGRCRHSVPVRGPPARGEGSMRKPRCDGCRTFPSSTSVRAGALSTWYCRRGNGRTSMHTRDTTLPAWRALLRGQRGWNWSRPRSWRIDAPATGHLVVPRRRRCTCPDAMTRSTSRRFDSGGGGGGAYH